MATEHPLYDLVRRNADSCKPYLHVVGFTFPPGVSEEVQISLMQKCNALFATCGGRDAGIISLTTYPNVDPRKGFVWVEVGMFASPEAFIAFHAHPAHKIFAEEAAGVADKWVVLDVSLSSPLESTTSANVGRKTQGDGE